MKRASVLNDLKFIADNSVDLSDDNLAFVKAAIAQAASPEFPEDRLIEILEAVGHVCVMGYDADDCWELIDEKFYPSDI